MGQRARTSTNLGPLAKPGRSRSLRPKKVVGEFEWLARYLIEPASYDAAASGLLESCDSGRRHFAANGRAVTLTEAAKMAHEIRLCDLQKDDNPRVAVVTSSGYQGGDSPRPQASGQNAAADLPSANGFREVKPARSALPRSSKTQGTGGVPSHRPFVGGTKMGREQHFDGGNVEESRHSIDEFRQQLYQLMDPPLDAD